jgi:hypothetical protein
MNLRWMKVPDEEVGNIDALQSSNNRLCAIDDDIYQIQGSKRRNTKNSLFILLITICIGITIVSLYALRSVPAAQDLVLPPLTAVAKTETTERWEDCGGTPEEARRRNCHFDLLSMAWQTHECFDHATASIFLSHHEHFNTSNIHSNHAVHEDEGQQIQGNDAVVTAWKFFLDEAGQEEIPLSVAESGEHTIYVTQEYHYTHCTYMWRQVHQAYAKLGYIDSHLANWRHTLHCQGVLLAGMGDKDQIGGVGEVIYPRCIKVGDGLGGQGLIQAGPY